jgi:AraC-like DNA-binding protein
MGDDLGAEGMASAACYSIFYFSRLFAQATGHAPYDYLMRRRVAEAAEELIGSSRSITEIALERGFDVPDSFARAFRRCFGILPSDARKQGSYPRSIARTRIERAYVEEMLGNPPAAPDAIMAGDETIVGVWQGGSGAEIESCLASASVGLAVVERDGSLRPKRAFVGRLRAAGGESGDAPIYPLAATSIPGGGRARFRIGGGAERLGFVAEYAYRTWLPLSGRTRATEYDIVEAVGDGCVCMTIPLA